MWTNNFKKLLFNRQSTINFEELPNLIKNRKKLLQLLSDKNTPFYVADQKLIGRRVQKLKNVLTKSWGEYKIAYSFKTNYEAAKLDVFKENGLYAEVVSGKEYRKAKKIGYKSSDIIFNGPLKTNKDLKKAINNSVFIFVDNFEELSRIIYIVNILKKEYSLGVRLKAENVWIGESRFGFSINNGDAAKAVKKIEKNPYLLLTGFHMHIGTDIDKKAPYIESSKSMASFIKNNVANYKSRIKILDFGGGFPANGLPPFNKPRWNPMSVDVYVRAIAGELNKIFNGKLPTLILEPGRYLVDDAVIFITKIININHSNKIQVLTVDATLTMLPLVHYRPQIVKLLTKNLVERKGELFYSKVYGASCREDDLLYEKRLPKTQIGDLLVYYVTGAYSKNMSSEFIFDVPQFYII